MRGLLLAVLVICGCLVSAAAAGDLNSRDFAYGFLLEAPDKGAVYSLPVPAEVYRTVRRADLGDVRIFNGAGEPVPHALRALENPAEESGKARELPFFPLFEPAAASGDTMSLSVRRNADGTIIDIDSTPLVQGERQPTGYLLDLGEKPEDGGSIELFWQADGTRGSSSVLLQQSADLQRWRVLVAQTTLVDLEYGGSRVVQRKIELPRRPERYLKVVWLPQQPPLKLQRVTVAARPPVSRQNMQWASLYNGVKSRVEAQTVIDFQSPYRLPVRSVRFQFPEMNSIVSASLQSRRDPETGWREQCRGVFYTLEVNGARVQSEPCSFRTVSDQEWRLVVLDDGAGLGGGDRNLTLDLGWQSDELLFLARGTGPFMLAFGSGRLENGEAKAGADMVLMALQQQEGNLVLPAMVGKRLTLGGEEALVAPPPAKPWRTWLLWAVLVAGVIGMAVMAVSLMKELRPKKPE